MCVIRNVEVLEYVDWERHHNIHDFARPGERVTNVKDILSFGLSLSLSLSPSALILLYRLPFFFSSRHYRLRSCLVTGQLVHRQLMQLGQLHRADE